MKIINITPRGYCKGVVHAIHLAKKASKDYPNETITVLGELVHNDDVVKGLQDLNIHTIESKDTPRIELLDQVNEGVIIFTAHGINPKVIEKAQAKGLKTLDASCVDVISTQKLVNRYLEQGYSILYIGKKGHPESEAICTTNTNRIHLITNISDFDQLHIDTDKLFLTNQTTMSLLDIKILIEEARKRYPNIIVSNEVCSATRLRQEAVLNLEEVDCLIVVGDSKSNNSSMLAQIGINKGIKHVHFVQNFKQLKEFDLVQHETIAITSGASTPTFITNQVIAYCEAIRDGLDPEHQALKIKAFL